MIVAVFSLLQLVLVVALVWINRKTLRDWKLSLRREWLLVLMLRASTSIENEEARHPLLEALALELVAQQHVRPWTRIPNIDEPW